MKKVFSKKYLISILLALLLFFPETSLALELTYPTIKIPGVGDVTLSLDMPLNQLIAWFYYFFLSIAGIAAFVMIVWGGIQYLTSAGKPAVMGEAKDRIFKAFLGLIILLSSYLILNTISPSLVLLKPPTIEKPGPPPKVPEVIVAVKAKSKCNYLGPEQAEPPVSTPCKEYQKTKLKCLEDVPIADFHPTMLPVGCQINPLNLCMGEGEKKNITNTTGTGNCITKCQTFGGTPAHIGKFEGKGTDIWYCFNPTEAGECGAGDTKTYIEKSSDCEWSLE